ncbi:hypothetical protein WG904_03365 [Pedobacter sp. Du54]|uniref:hypothetical protein n=1 Tax=Pedobacter anseongensis TaxID=3133439 RepID=UPI0030A0551E
MKENRTPWIITTAVRSLRIEILILFIISFGSVLLIELLLKNWPAPNQSLYAVGDIYLKLCYSFTASIIFFFINVQYPKEIKRVKAFSLIRNPTGNIQRDINILMSTLFPHTELRDKDAKPLLPGYERFKEAMAAINPLDKPKFFPKAIVLYGEFSNYFQVYAVLIERIEENAKLALTFHDLMDNDLIQAFEQIITSTSIIKSTITVPGYWAAVTPMSVENLHRIYIKFDQILDKKYKHIYGQASKLDK